MTPEPRIPPRGSLVTRVTRHALDLPESRRGIRYAVQAGLFKPSFDSFWKQCVFCWDWFLFATPIHWISKTYKIITARRGSARNFTPKSIRFELDVRAVETICTQTIINNCNNAGQGWAVAVELCVMGARMWSSLGQFYI